MLTLADVFEALTNIRPAQANTVITEAAVDSRLAIPGGLFVALPGERLDGHDFVADAFQRGASFALIQHKISAAYHTISLQAGMEAAFPPEMDAPVCLLVENTLSALQQIARFWRRKLDLGVVGITGSVGKSTSKEVIFEVLSQRYRTLKSLGNMNNEIGLPLTILNSAPAMSGLCWKWVFTFLAKLPCYAILPSQELAW